MRQRGLDYKILPLGSAVSVILGILILVTLVEPVYTFSGIVRGYVSFTHYSVAIYGEARDMEIFDALKMLSLPTALLAVYLIATPIMSRDEERLRNLLFGGALSSIALEPMIILLKRVADAGARDLALNLRYRTSAGMVSFGGSSAHPNPMFTSLAMLVVVLTTVFVVVTVVAHHLAERQAPQADAP